MSKSKLWACSLLLASSVACGGPQAQLPALTNSPADPGAITVNDSAIGPLRATTPATLTSLRERLAGYDVKPVNDNGLEFHVSKDGQPLYSVIPDEAGAIFNIHIVSPKVVPANHPWQVGAAFRGAAALSTCDCWGTRPVCFKKGEHIAARFDRGCAGLDDAGGRRRLEGDKIQSLVWSPKPFGSEDDAYGGHEYGGDDPCGGADPCAP